MFGHYCSSSIWVNVHLGEVPIYFHEQNDLVIVLIGDVFLGHRADDNGPAAEERDERGSASVVLSDDWPIIVDQN